MRRVIAYFDGFNLYHAIDALKKPHLKWVDLRKLAASLCGQDEMLVGTNFFTAYPNWKNEAVVRHREYVKALKHADVRCFIGHFKEKPQTCKSCGARWIRHEEKETDVAIAVQITVDAFTDRFDRALIISADSDLAPPIRAVRHHFPDKKLHVIAPPGRLGQARDLQPILEITPGRIAKCLLPATVADQDGQTVFVRPGPYAPPVTSLP
jgi:uncharacterized LabA/DUF88 family protein